jgi:mannan endo-1,4-beta-mannosidase
VKRAVKVAGAVLAVAAVAAAVTVAGVRDERAGDKAEAGRIAAMRPARASLGSKPGAYIGVYQPGAPASAAPVADFGKAAGVKVGIAAYYSTWGEPFQGAFAAALARGGAVPLVQVEPYGTTLAAIADGDDDAYLLSYATAVRLYGKAVVISFGHEMNGPWYPWGAGNVPAAVFVAAWRHIVDVFRSDGAGNVTWLWAVNVTSGSGGSVSGPAAWWPGSSYVTWVGVDGYFYQPSQTFASLFSPTITLIRRLTRDPLFIAETGIAPPDQAAKIPGLFAGAQAAGVVGLLWFDDDKPSAHGPDHDWRIDNDPAALAAFKTAAEEYR